MINELLVAIANRTTGFSYPSLNVYQTFNKVTDANANAVRHILTNDDEKWIISLIWLIMYDPYVSLTWNPGINSSDMTDILVPRGLTTGGELVANGNGPASVTENNLGMTWPFDTTVTVKYASKKAVNIIVGDNVYASNIAVTGNRISMEWPDGIGINGDIVLDAPYGASTVFTIDVPAPYPYEQVTALLDDSDELFEVLQKANLEDSYYFADNLHEKVAIAGIALYRVFQQYQ